ncbi:MAG TPA: hypothetical protein VHX52_11785 [Steroidobacteraceae bacterium]|jgi:hypothetical protein|nr:hypothetical protein [Steroidobacteraceae bacterium]
MDRRLKGWYWALGYAVVALVSAFCALAQPVAWPVVRPMRAMRTFVNPGRGHADTPFVAMLRDVTGLAVYKLECHNGNYRNVSELKFSGDFQCALFATRGTAVMSDNLLAANTGDAASANRWNRGRMRAVQLRGQCLTYPDYGAERRFKLRGMLLTLQFTGLQWSAPGIQGSPMLNKFTFSFRVVPDTSATGWVADVPGGPRPPDACYT